MLDDIDNRNEAIDQSLNGTWKAIYEYWEKHTLGMQYISDGSLVVGSQEFFAHIRPWMNPWKFPWIMERINREAMLLRGKQLLEVGCGMGYDSLEFLNRGVRVTATDLTSNAVILTRRHYELECVQAEDVLIADALALPFNDCTYDAYWANGVLHTTINPELAISEARRVIKSGGRAVISHFYRKPSWMYLLSRIGRENIEFKDEDPPINHFYTEAEILNMFKGFEVVEAIQEHYRALPIHRRGLKATLYKSIFMPVYNLIPELLAKRFAYKFSVTAVKL